jgi:hypothetical protein
MEIHPVDYLIQRRKKLEQFPQVILQEFLSSFFYDAASLKEVREVLEELAQQNDFLIAEAFISIQKVMEMKLQKGALSALVTIDAGWILEDATDESALVWLKQVSAMLQEILGYPSVEDQI